MSIFQQIKKCLLTVSRRLETRNGSVEALQRPVAVDSHRFDDEQDPDPHQNEKRDPDPDPK